MFVSSGQIFVFLACLSVGGVSGVFLSLSTALKRLFKRWWVGVILDTFAFFMVTVIYFLASQYFKFPSVRAYMIAGVLLGVWAYMKSFHIILAKSLFLVYNISKRYIKIRKVRRKNDGRKTKKANSCRRGRCCIVGVNSHIGYGLSTDSDRGCKQA